MTIKSIFNGLRYAGAHNLPEYDVQRGVCVGVNLMCISIVILNAVSGTLFYLLSGNLSVLIGAFAEIALVLGILGLNSQRRYELANACFYTIIVLATFYFSTILGKSSETQLMILFILGLTFFLFRKISTRIFCIVITLLLLAALETNFLFQFIPSPTYQPVVALAVRYLVYGVVISLVLLIFYLYNKNTRLVIQLYSYSKSIGASLKSEERMNELKNLFFKSISHDIRSMYAGVSTIAFSIKLQIDEGKTVDPAMTQQLMEASDHYKFLLNNFLELSKFKDAAIDQINLEVFNLKKEIEKIVELHQYVANQKQVTVHMVFTFGFPQQIVGDKLKITRIIYNLLSNALKFTPAGSAVHITVEGTADTWKLTIRDEGKGIPTNRLRKLFLPYETEISVYNPEGVGLGLYITKYIADLLTATIHAHNAPEGGACFEVEFPMIKKLVTA